MSLQEKNNDLDEWIILRDIYKMLVDANVLNPKHSTPIVKFKHPDELMVIHFFISLLTF